MTEVERLIALLYSADAREAGSRLVEIGTPAVEPLIAVLSGQHPTPDLSQLATFSAAPDGAAARERAAYLLGDIGDSRAVEPLKAAYTRETGRHIRLAAVLALGKIGDPRAVTTLVAALETPAWTPDYARIVDDLARIAGVNAIDTLIHVAQSPGYSYGAAAHAVNALLVFRATIGADPRVLDALIGALRPDAEIATVQAVIAALAEIGDPRCAQALIAFIRKMIQFPPERWDGRESNMSETDQGMVFHILKSHLNAAVAAVRKIGDAETLAVLEEMLRGAPSYVPVV